MTFMAQALTEQANKGEMALANSIGGTGAT